MRQNERQWGGNSARHSGLTAQKNRSFAMKAFLAGAVVALGLLSRIALAQNGTSPFCLQTAAGAKCAYMTMAECERARGNSSASQCITQADAKGATGLREPLARRPAYLPGSEAVGDR
jgi:hypothetical protein